MRKLAAIIAPILVLALIFAIGCGGDEAATSTPQPTPTSAPTATPEPTTPPSVTPTPAVTQPPTPTATPRVTEPPIPCRFFGEVQLDGASVPDGTVITIIVDGDEYVINTPSAIYGPSTYAKKVEPIAGSSYSDGTIVTFKIGDYPADQTGVWETGGNFKLDLSATT